MRLGRLMLKNIVRNPRRTALTLLIMTASMARVDRLNAKLSGLDTFRPDLVMATEVSIFSSALPALRASRMPIADALRHVG